MLNDYKQMITTLPTNQMLLAIVVQEFILYPSKSKMIAMNAKTYPNAVYLLKLIGSYPILIVKLWVKWLGYRLNSDNGKNYEAI